MSSGLHRHFRKFSMAQKILITFIQFSSLSECASLKPYFVCDARCHVCLSCEQRKLSHERLRSSLEEGSVMEGEVEWRKQTINMTVLPLILRCRPPSRDSNCGEEERLSTWEKERQKQIGAARSSWGWKGSLSCSEVKCIEMALRGELSVRDRVWLAECAFMRLINRVLLNSCASNRCRLKHERLVGGRYPKRRPALKWHAFTIRRRRQTSKLRVDLG